MSRNQGFELEKNLAESVSDGSILDNLGGGNISADISLFRNNTNNTSELIWERNTDASYVESNKFVFPRSVLFIFTNGDEVKVSGPSLGNLNINTTYYIVDYEENLGDQRNQLGFGLATTVGGTRVSLGLIGSDVIFTRKDEVTLDNILNLATPDTQNNEGELDLDGRFDYNIGSSFSEGFNTVDSNIDLFNFLRRGKYVSNDSVSTDNRVVIEGFVNVDDPADTNDSQADLDKANSPGIFITNPFSPDGILGIEKTRAFSTSSNPFEEVTGALKTRSAQVNIGDLFFEEDISFSNFSGVSFESGNATGFTHKLPVLIDGIEYFVLVKS